MKNLVIYLSCTVNHHVSFFIRGKCLIMVLSYLEFKGNRPLMITENLYYWYLFIDGSDLKNQTIVSSCVTHILPSCGYFKGQEQICFNPTSWHLVTYNFLRGHKF